MKANYIGLFFVVFGVLSFCGCGNETPQPPTQQQPAAPVQAAPKTETPAQPAPPAANPVEHAGSQKAAVGVGAKGRGYGQGVVATPAASLFATRERLVFEIQIPQAVQLFKATEDRGPKSHAEFMEKIVKANQIHLPQLPEDKQYRYDPKTEQLMVDPKTAGE